MRVITIPEVGWLRCGTPWFSGGRECRGSGRTWRGSYDGLEVAHASVLDAMGGNGRVGFDEGRIE